MQLPFDAVATAPHDNPPTAVCARQRRGLVSLIETYIDRLRPGHTEVNFAWL